MSQTPMDWGLRLSDVKRTQYGMGRCGKCKQAVLLTTRLSYGGGHDAPGGHRHGDAWTDFYVCDPCASDVLKGRTLNVFGAEAV